MCHVYSPPFSSFCFFAALEEAGVAVPAWHNISFTEEHGGIRFPCRLLFYSPREQK